MRRMRKFKLMAIVILFVSALANGQGLPIDQETKKILFQETVSMDSVSRDELYIRGKEWIMNFYKTDKLTPDDKANFKIGKEGVVDVQLTYDYKYKSHNNVSYSLLIGQKEGKYRYTLTDFRIYNVKLGEKTAQTLELAMSKMSAQNKSETTAQLNKAISDVIADMKRFIETGKPENKEDW